MHHLRLFVTIALLAALATLTGCDWLQQLAAKAAATPKPQKAQNRGTPHRFVLTKFGAQVAFDTQTGQICKTWEWEASGPLAKPDPVTGGVPERSFGEFSPTCLSLYLEHPSTGLVTTVTESDESAGQ